MIVDNWSVDSQPILRALKKLENKRIKIIAKDSAQDGQMSALSPRQLPSRSLDCERADETLFKCRDFLILRYAKADTWTRIYDTIKGHTTKGQTEMLLCQRPCSSQDNSLLNDRSAIGALAAIKEQVKSPIPLSDLWIDGSPDESSCHPQMMSGTKLPSLR